MLECNNIVIKAGNKLLFHCKRLELSSGLYALVGRNGSGKSTFLNTLMGELSPAYGRVKLNGRSLDQFGLGELAKMVSIVRSKPVLYGDYKAGDILMLGRLPYQNMLSRVSQKDDEIVADVARNVGISALLKQEYNQLSDGERQLVMVARAFVQNTAVVLLDEPSAFLDLVNRQSLLKRLKKMASNQNKLIIFSTHHVEILDQYCEGMLLIADGELSCIEDKALFGKEIKTAFGLNNLL